VSAADRTFRVVPIPCLQDNYAYLVVSDATGDALVVDPSETEPVAAALAKEGRTLGAILCTHHHGDHVGGVPGLVERARSMAVYGHESETSRIPEITAPLADGATFRVGAISVRAMHVPGHTTGALAYVVGERAVFTGDTMFVAGCGRLFEGTPAMMARSLGQIASLASATEVYPGHVYAEKNLRFARTVEPDHAAVAERYARVVERRGEGKFCVPSTIAEENATNPFLRASADGVKRFAAARGADPDDPVAVLAAVRSARDGF
jgi:hydroxyacylglutathione hydrolase